jgi:hypothetical protein
MQELTLIFEDEGEAAFWELVRRTSTCNFTNVEDYVFVLIREDLAKTK